MDITFKNYEPDEDNYSFQIDAFDGDTFLGSIDINPDTLNVSMIKVEEQFRRRGIGTLLFQQAKLQHPEVTTYKRTPDGEAFFSALGISEVEEEEEDFSDC